MTALCPRCRRAGPLPAVSQTRSPRICSTSNCRSGCTQAAQRTRKRLGGTDSADGAGAGPGSRSGGRGFEPRAVHQFHQQFAARTASALLAAGAQPGPGRGPHRRSEACPGEVVRSFPGVRLPKRRDSEMRTPASGRRAEWRCLVNRRPLDVSPASGGPTRYRLVLCSTGPRMPSAPALVRTASSPSRRRQPDPPRSPPPGGSGDPEGRQAPKRPDSLWNDQIDPALRRMRRYSLRGTREADLSHARFRTHQPVFAVRVCERTIRPPASHNRDLSTRDALA